MMISVFDRIENIVRKGENVGYQLSCDGKHCDHQHFLLLVKTGCVTDHP